MNRALAQGERIGGKEEKEREFTETEIETERMRRKKENLYIQDRGEIGMSSETEKRTLKRGQRREHILRGKRDIEEKKYEYIQTVPLTAVHKHVWCPNVSSWDCRLVNTTTITQYLSWTAGDRWPTGQYHFGDARSKKYSYIQVTLIHDSLNPFLKGLTWLLQVRLSKKDNSMFMAWGKRRTSVLPLFHTSEVYTYFLLIYSQLTSFDSTIQFFCSIVAISFSTWIISANPVSIRCIERPAHFFQLLTSNELSSRCCLTVFNNDYCHPITIWDMIQSLFVSHILFRTLVCYGNLIDRYDLC